MRRSLLAVIALAAVYWVAARLGLLLAFEHSNASPVWPPSGIAFAALALGGRRLAPGIALGAFVANVQGFAANQAASAPVIAALSAAIALGNTLEAWLAVTAFRRWAGAAATPFERLPDVAKFAVVALAACAVAAGIGALGLRAGGIVPAAATPTVALTWWIGDVAGMLVVAPLLIAWRSLARPQPARLAEALASLALLVGIGMFALDSGDRRLVWLLVPCLAWAALRFGARGVTAVTSIGAGTAVWLTTNGRGPFAGGSLNDALILLETFVVLWALTGLVLAADRHERLRLRRSRLSSDLVAPWVVLAGCVGVAVVAWDLVLGDIERGARERFDTAVAAIEQRIADRMRDYEQMLRGAAGLFAASQAVDRDEWRRYVERLQIEQAYPGVQALAYARIVGDVDAHERELRAEGFADYTLRPPGRRDETSAIVFIEPFDARNRRAFGFDMLSEPTRRAAMHRARDSGGASVSGKVTLVQETASDVQAGVLMYLPVYRNGAPTANAEQRRAALLGFVYSAFRMNNLMRGVLGPELAGVALRIADADGGALLYDSVAAAPPGHATPAHGATRQLDLPGRQWRLELASLPAFEVATDRQKAQIVLVAGVVLSLLLFTLVRTLTLTRERAELLAEDMTRSLRDSESAAREAEQQLRAVMNASPVGVVFTDAGGRLAYGNPSYLRMAGTSLDEARSDGGLRTIHRDDRERVRRDWLAAARGATPFDAEYRYVHAGDRVVWAHARSAAIVDGEQVLGHVAIIEDVTERRAMDAELLAKTGALERSNRELEQFAYVASHDLQEPLRTVGSYSQLLLRRHRTRMDDEAREFLDFIGDGAKRAQALIADLLALARLDSRARPFAPLELGDALDDARKALRASLRDSGATLTHDEPLPRVDGDRAQLAQLLQNLIGNALKFRGVEPPHVHVGAARCGDGGWRIAVSDNGIGIDARFHERIFTLFQRLHGRDEYPGTGIGLAICRKVVERHGGRIGVESAPGRGSTFFFTIADRALPADEEQPT